VRRVGLAKVRSGAHAAPERSARSKGRTQVRWDRTAAATTQTEPAAPVQITDRTEITMDPNAAPNANPAYMKDALSDSPTDHVVG
jgi:hypothetical protein